MRSSLRQFLGGKRLGIWGSSLQDPQTEAELCLHAVSSPCVTVVQSLGRVQLCTPGFLVLHYWFPFCSYGFYFMLLKTFLSEMSFSFTGCQRKLWWNGAGSCEALLGTFLSGFLFVLNAG